MTVAHAQHAGALPNTHRDLFDRMLAARGLLENVPIVGRDEALADFGVQLIW
jgi:PIN domain nuclease of toxin-antitoxin system